MTGDPWFAWRALVARRDSTDTSVLDHPLLREAFQAGHGFGFRAAIADTTDVGGALHILRRLAQRLEDLEHQRDAVASLTDDSLEDLPF